MEKKTKTHYKTMKKQISTQLKANLRKMGKEWAAANTNGFAATYTRGQLREIANAINAYLAK